MVGTIVPTIRNPNHSKTDLQNVRFSNVSGFRRVGFQIPTVFTFFSWRQPFSRMMMTTITRTLFQSGKLRTKPVLATTTEEVGFLRHQPSCQKYQKSKRLKRDRHREPGLQHLLMILRSNLLFNLV